MNVLYMGMTVTFICLNRKVCSFWFFGREEYVTSCKCTVRHGKCSKQLYIQRKIIAERLDMSESSLIDFCLYLGMITRLVFQKTHFIRKGEETVNELLESYDMHSVARTFSAYDDDSLDCNTADCNLNQAISFSRALYGKLGYFSI